MSGQRTPRDSRWGTNHGSHQNSRHSSRKFESLGGSLSSGLKFKSWFKHAVALQGAWEDVADESVLAHTDNVINDKKRGEVVVVVFVDSAQWAAQLNMDKEYYRIELGHALERNLEEVRFVVSQKTGVRKEFKKAEQMQAIGKFANVESVPLSAEEEKLVRFSLDEIEDEKLREKVFKALKADIEWKKGINASKSSHD